MSLPILRSDAAIPKSEDACDALERIHPVRTRHLTAIYLDGRVEPKSFHPSQREEMLRWIEAHQGVANIYFSVNGPKAGIENVKTKKSDIALGFYIHVDLDDPNALDLIAMLLPAPTFVVFSGGGFQIFWALAEPCTDIDRLERINAAMAKRVGGDHCHNADRVMRVPFTINLPNEKKRARGRTETLAYVVAELTDWTRRYSLDEFPELELTQEQSKSITIRQVTEVELATLPIGDFTRNLIELGHDPEHPPGTAGSRYPSRSEAVFRVCCDLVRIGCAPEAIAGILLNRKYAISASVLEKPNPKQYAERQIVSATDAVSRGWPDTKLSGAPDQHLGTRCLQFDVSA